MIPHRRDEEQSMVSRRQREVVVAMRYHQLDRRVRRRATANTVGMLIVIWIVLIGLYYLLPGSGYNGTRELLRLLVALVLVGVVFAWQLRRVMHAAMPELQAIQALGSVIPLFLLTFAAVYLSMSHASPAAFSESLDHTGAMYLSVTIFSTVGFGDITPVSGTARIAVVIQMLLDLVILGVVVRSIFGAAKVGIERRGVQQEDEPDAR